MRIALALAVVVAAPLATVVPASGSPPLVGSSHYVVRVDPRLCPSPMCGGYWVALANRARTRCSDAALRPRCYVARALDEDRHPLPVALPDGALVRAEVEPWTYPGFGDLGALVVADVRWPVGKGTKGVYYRVRDLGIRCVRAPCFSFRAARLNGSARRAVSSLDLLAAAPNARELASAQAALRAPNGLFLLGRSAETSDAGRILRASRLYLRVPPPRG